jgi:hypothetical protein
MPDFRQTITNPVVCKKTTSDLTLQLTDEANVNLPSAQVTTLTLTLYEKKTQAILNSRSAQTILSANGGTLASGGLLTLLLSNLDNALTQQTVSSEDHVALIEWTWASGARYGKKEITFSVINQAKVS